MHAVFTLVTIIFVICVSVTMNSFREIPLWKLESQTQNVRDVAATENGMASTEQHELTENDKLQQSNKNGSAVYGTLSNDTKDVSVFSLFKIDSLAYSVHLSSVNFFFAIIAINQPAEYDRNILHRWLRLGNTIKYGRFRSGCIIRTIFDVHCLHAAFNSNGLLDQFILLDGACMLFIVFHRFCWRSCIFG